MLFEDNHTLDSLVRILDLNIRPKSLEEDIWSLKKSGKHKGYQLLVHPAHCLNCGFRFKITRLYPSRCPQCKAERISPSLVRAVPSKKQKYRKER